jgi:hypothetical protein
MPTQTRKRSTTSSNGRRKAQPTPDLMGVLKRGPGRPRTRLTTPEIADRFEAEAQRLKIEAGQLEVKAELYLQCANTLRGKA